MNLAFILDLGQPPAIVPAEPTHSFEPGGASLVPATVPCIPAVVSQPQVAAAIVQPVAVDVVYLDAGGRMGNHSVHAKPFATLPAR
jgi:hypothetical protein